MSCLRITSRSLSFTSIYILMKLLCKETFLRTRVRIKFNLKLRCHLEGTIQRSLVTLQPCVCPLMEWNKWLGPQTELGTGSFLYRGVDVSRVIVINHDQRNSDELLMGQNDM